jgi:hypothetical protein
MGSLVCFDGSMSESSFTAEAQRTERNAELYVMPRLASALPLRPLLLRGERLCLLSVLHILETIEEEALLTTI